VPDYVGRKTGNLTGGGKKGEGGGERGFWVYVFGDEPCREIIQEGACLQIIGEEDGISGEATEVI